MAETWALTQYVEAHPDNQEQRWRLAKKLYKEEDYRLAIEHLQILSNEWKDKSGIPRYLAATYMRLGRAEEAVGVLEESIETWPTDAKMLEQLAMVYESSGRKENAAVAWAEVLKQNPGHTFAIKAGRSIVRQLKKDHQDRTASNPTGRVGSAGNVVVCARCGAENTPEQLSCMKCNFGLDLVADIVGEHSEDTPEPLNIFPPLAKLSIVAGLIYGGYKTNSVLSLEPSTDVVFEFRKTLLEVITVDMITTRIVLGLALLIAWPFFNQSAQYAAGVGRIRTDSALLQSMVFAVLAYALSWLPGVGVTAWIVIMLGFTLAVTIGVFWKRWGQAAQVWALQCMFVAILMTTVLGAMHGTNLVRELFAVESFVREHPTMSSLELSAETPFSQELRWESTGSSWVDEFGDIVGIRFQMSPAAISSNLKIEFGSDESVILYQRLVGTDMILSAENIEPDKVYTLRLKADEPTSVTVTVASVLPVHQN
ncbi:MAG TPA: hypothetical protein EYN96_04850 [Candidatus Hydrogenedentes bacterium]|nr:hypothetical protein [Candidatus Hydrogenedentota bacterium]